MGGAAGHGFLNALRQTQTGAAILTEWLGDGLRPVSKSEANSRMRVCLHGNNGEPCPENRAGKWWEKSKDAIAETIRTLMIVKHQMNVQEPDRFLLTHEDELFMCRACGCCLRLKAWTPIEHIHHHLDEETKAKLPAYCWILKDQHELQHCD